MPISNQTVCMYIDTSAVLQTPRAAGVCMFTREMLKLCVREHNFQELQCTRVSSKLKRGGD